MLKAQYEKFRDMLSSPKKNICVECGKEFVTQKHKPPYPRLCRKCLKIWRADYDRVVLENKNTERQLNKKYGHRLKNKKPAQTAGSSHSTLAPVKDGH